MNSRWNENLIIFTMALVSTRSNCWIKIRVSRGHQESTLGQTWSNLLKIFEEVGFDIKSWKMLFCEYFNIVWPLVNPGLTRGILVILAKKGTLSAPVSKRVAPLHYICSYNPMEREWYFWVFQGPTSKSRADKIQYQLLPLLYLIPRVQWEVSDKEHDFIFCHP